MKIFFFLGFFIFLAFSALLFLACGTEAEDGIITTAYGVSVESIPQKDEIDSIRVFVVISGDTASSELYDASEIEDNLVVFNIDAPSEVPVRVITLFYDEGYFVAIGDYFFLSGDTPVVPDPKRVNPTKLMVDTRDGQEYYVTLIGNQTWMAENLNYSGNDGAGNKTYDIGWCYGVAESDTSIHTDSATCDTYGRLYTWDMVMDGAASSDANPSAVQGICPDGWHVPSDAEWTILSDAIIANTLATDNDNNGPFLKATSGWYSSGNGTDEFGFSALPGGRRYSNGDSDGVGTFGYWWSATESGTSNAYSHYLYYGDDDFYRYDQFKSFAHSVRCVQDY